MKRHARFGIVLSAVLVGMAGCTPDQDTRNIVEVFSINDNLPLLSDVYNYGKNLTSNTDDFIPSDLVEVTFVSRAHDTISDPGPFGTVTITSYDVIYGAANGTGADLDGDGTIDLANFTANLNALVPTGGSGSAAVLIVSGAQKAVPPISCLGPAGGGCVTTTNEFTVNVTVVFHGTEETSDADITFQTGLLVRIAQYADAST